MAQSILFRASASMSGDGDFVTRDYSLWDSGRKRFPAYQAQ